MRRGLRERSEDETPGPGRDYQMPRKKRVRSANSSMTLWLCLWLFLRIPRWPKVWQAALPFGDLDESFPFSAALSETCFSAVTSRVIPSKQAGMPGYVRNVPALWRSAMSISRFSVRMAREPKRKAAQTGWERRGILTDDRQYRVQPSVEYVEGRQYGQIVV
jgi:hypothetical protein